MRQYPRSRSRSATWLVALTMLGALTSAAHAQAVSADTLGAVDGTVVDSAGRGVGGVEVSVMDARQSVRTTAAGGYRIEGVPIGPHMLRFRRLGLNAVVLGVTLRPDEVTGVDVVMARSTYQLATVEVRAAGGSVWALPRTFVQRMQTGMGTYLTEADVVERRCGGAGIGRAIAIRIVRTGHRRSAGHRRDRGLSRAGGAAGGDPALRVRGDHRVDEVATGQAKRPSSRHAVP